MKREYGKKRPVLHFEDAARFNWAMDTNENLQKGLLELADSYPGLTEEEYIKKMLELFRRAGLNLSCEDLKILLALRQKTDQLLLKEKEVIKDED